MRKIKSKLTAMLMAFASLFVFLGVFAIVSNVGNTAYAASTFVISKLAPDDNPANSPNVIYAHTLEGDVPTLNNWESAFTFVEGTGDGFLFNNEKLDQYTVKQPGSGLYFVLGAKNAEAGDVVVLDGRFYSADLDASLAFENCGLRFDGTKWETYYRVVVRDVHDIGELKLHANSATGGAKKNTGSLYLQRADGEALPIQEWENPFAYVSGSGLKINGKSATLKEMQSTGDGFYLSFDDVNAGATVSIGGTFYCEKKQVQYVIEESSFVWNGYAWKNQSDIVDYEDFNVGALKFSLVDNNGVYLKPIDERSLPVNSWDYAFSYVSGVGVTVNGVMADIGNSNVVDLKSINEHEIYIGGLSASSNGAVLRVGGTFRCDAAQKDYVIDYSEFVWNGTTWESATVASHDIGTLGLHVNSTVGGAKDSNTALYLTTTTGTALPFSGWSNPFVNVGGSGFKINGYTVPLKEMQSADGFIYLAFDGLDANDVLTVGGTFYCENQKLTYTIQESHFQWTSSGWKVYVPATEHKIGSLVLHANSTVGGAKESNNILYLQRADGEALPILNWDVAFTYKSGTGFLVNGYQRTPTSIKSTGDGFYWQFDAVNVGEVITIGGVFYCESQNVQYVIEKSYFQWTSSGWKVYVPATEHKIGSLVLHNNSTVGGAKESNNILYLKRADGEALPILSWEWAFTYKSGTGFLVNGYQRTPTSINSTGDGFYWQFDEVEAGEVVTIGGVFYCESQNVQYAIENSHFKWTGTGWEEYYPATTHRIGALELHNNSTIGDAKNLNNVLYLKRVDGGALPVQTWDHTFEFVSGDGLEVNGTSVGFEEMKSTDGGLYIKFDGLNAKDVISISGTFHCADLNVTYVIEESVFKWTGSNWKIYANIDYQEIQLGELAIGTTTTSKNHIYLNSESFQLVVPTEGDAHWNTAFDYDNASSVITLNDNAIMPTIKFPDCIFVELSSTPNVGDVVVIEGQFYNEEYAVKYVIQKSVVFFNGNEWSNYHNFTDEELAFYDVVTITDIGQPTTEYVEDNFDGSGLTYIPSTGNTTGSVKFRLGYNSTDVSTGAISIRLRGENWAGIHFRIIGGHVETYYSSIIKTHNLTSNTDYVIEFGAIDHVDGEHIWIYLQVDGVLVSSDLVSKTDTVRGDDANKAFSEFTTSSVSVNFADVAVTKVFDPDHVTVTYQHSKGSFIEYVPRNGEYAIANGRSSKAFVGWAYDGNLYSADAVFTIGDEDIVFEAVELDFKMEEGASILISDTADKSGIRFTALLNQADLEALSAYGVTNVSYGVIIVPYDYLGYNQAPNLVDFKEATNGGSVGNKDLLVKLPSNTEVKTIKDGYIEFRGSMRNMYASNYQRLFAGRGYVEVTLSNGETLTVYTPFSVEENVRSIDYVASRYQESANYEGLTTEKKAVVDAYANRDSIKLVDYNKYLANGYFSATAWYYPELDASNGYKNAKNDEIALKMIQAGIKVVYLDGKYHLNLDTDENIAKTRQIIEFFWSHGMYTIAFGSNAGVNKYIDYGANDVSYPDFSDVEGFMGYLVWDEPQSTSFEDLAKFAQKFESVYAGTGVTFMANLLPSYASIFNGSTNWWESTLDGLKKDEYKNYLETYSNTVLSQISGEKWLSMDSYPINADKSLSPYFLFDLAMLKYYSIQSGATSHAVLQSCGWVEGGNTTKNRMPYQAEMEMQAYAAMAFGIDSISWWSYGDMRGEGSSTNPYNNTDAYNRFSAVNAELALVSSIYKSFDWKGVIMEKGNDVASNDYKAYNLVSGEIGDYELTVDDTKNISKLSSNKTLLNYLMGVMEDINGNEGYVLVNYNNHASDRSQTITITFKTNVTKVVIYRNGVATTVEVANKKLTVDLETGEGVIILPSELA